MAKYIDAEKLKAEIDNLESFSCISEEQDGFYSAINRINDIIASLQQEQPEVDYEAELKKCKDNPLYFYDKYVSIKQKSSWSKEDERMLSRCVKSIETSKQFADSNTFKEAKDKEIFWLKSLRPSIPTYNVGDKISRDGEVYTIDKVVCSDDRFEIIGRAKQELLDKTNIADSPEEMAVIDSFLFRCWQMGWLKE